MKNRIGLSAYSLQLVAIVAMFVDHFAHIVGCMNFSGSVYVAVAMNYIGRITMPIMCFFIAEGYHKTSNLRIANNKKIRDFTDFLSYKLALFLKAYKNRRQPPPPSPRILPSHYP